MNLGMWISLHRQVCDEYHNTLVNGLDRLMNITYELSHVIYFFHKLFNQFD